MSRITEQPSKYRNLEKMSVEELTGKINAEDKTVAYAIEKALPYLNELINCVVSKLEDGGRMFYVGAGSGGRLSVLDVIELPTTYGAPKGQINAILAGGEEHLIEALEKMEDDKEEGWARLQAIEISSKDIVIGISASGSTPFVLECLKKCREENIVTGCLVSNQNSEIAAVVDFPVEVITGTEFITGSTRMKCGTAQKMLFDIISTTTMVRLGNVEDNKMVNVALINDKITDRAVRMLMEMGHLDDYTKAKTLLFQSGSVKSALLKLSEIKL